MLNGNRQAILAFPETSVWFLDHRAQTGDTVLCFDEYVPYFSQRFEAVGYGSIDDNKEELPRLIAAAQPLLERTGLWVQCSPRREAGTTQAEWLRARGLYVADLRPKAGKGATLIASAPVLSYGPQQEDLEERWRAAEGKITPGPVKTTAEVAAWLVETYGAVPFCPLPHERDKVRQNILANTGGEGWDWDEGLTRLYDAPETVPPMDVRGFRIPPAGGIGEDMVIFMDLVSGHGQSRSGAEDIFSEIALFRGVTEEDVRTRSHRFQNYVYSMTALGGCDTKIIGITGPTGAGKTTALHALTDLGAVLLDADRIYHVLLIENKALKAELIARFGAILGGHGGVDRRKLAEMVFQDPAALEDLNRITHRYVGEEIDLRIREAEQRGRPAVAIDAIALLESGLGGRCDFTVAVMAPVEVRVGRIMAREGISEEYARKRVAAQKEDGFFRASCTYVLENTAQDTMEQFSARANAFFKKLL